MDNIIRCEPTAKKTLMDSVESLTSTANKFEELARLTESLVAKFERTECMSAKEGMLVGKKLEQSQPDLIDLFDNINNRLGLLLNSIGRNIEKVVDMID